MINVHTHTHMYLNIFLIHFDNLPFSKAFIHYCVLGWTRCNTCMSVHAVTCVWRPEGNLSNSGYGARWPEPVPEEARPASNLCHLLAAFRLQTNRVSAHLVGATSTTFAAMFHPLALSTATFLISSFSHFI